jgi:hypothetical protein
MVTPGVGLGVCGVEEHDARLSMTTSPRVRDNPDNFMPALYQPCQGENPDQPGHCKRLVRRVIHLLQRVICGNIIFQVLWRTVFNADLYLSLRKLWRSL